MLQSIPVGRLFCGGFLLQGWDWSWLVLMDAYFLCCSQDTSSFPVWLAGADAQLGRGLAGHRCCREGCGQTPSFLPWLAWPWGQHRLKDLGNACSSAGTGATRTLS